ncbi:MAG: hypothetical protein LBF40_03860 [Deltaproteobacteria bacterium]|jgi:hypothetical protein|nr:hypothetical protein [Deltaproteobacteria bacterium]
MDKGTIIGDGDPGLPGDILAKPLPGTGGGDGTGVPGADLLAPFFIGLFILGALCLAAVFLGDLRYGVWVLGVVILSVPVYVSLSYCDRGLDGPGRGDGAPFWRRPLANLLSALIAVFLSCGLALNLATLGSEEWPFVFLSLPVQLALFWLLGGRRRAGQGARPGGFRAARLSSLLGPAVTLAIYSVGMACLPDVAHAPAEGLGASQAPLFQGTDSKLLALLGDWLRYHGCGRDLALGAARAGGFWPWFLLNLAFLCPLFLGVGLLLRLATLPWAGALGTDHAKPAGKPQNQGAFGFLSTAALPCLLAAFLFLSLSQRLERAAAGEPGRRMAFYLESLRASIVLIDGVPYHASIIPALARANRWAGGRLEEAKGSLRRGVDRIHDGYKANVEPYLDWYYSEGYYSEGYMGSMGPYDHGHPAMGMGGNPGDRLFMGVDHRGVRRQLERLGRIASSNNVRNLAPQHRYLGMQVAEPLLSLRSGDIGREGGSTLLVPHQLRRAKAASDAARSLAAPPALAENVAQGDGGDEDREGHRDRLLAYIEERRADAHKLIDGL